jgi:hypothetical protein
MQLQPVAKEALSSFMMSVLFGTANLNNLEKPLIDVLRGIVKQYDAEQMKKVKA